MQPAQPRSWAGCLPRPAASLGPSAGSRESGSGQREVSLTPPSPQEKRSRHRTFRMVRKRWLTVPESRPPTTRRSGSAGGRARVGPTPTGSPQERGALAPGRLKHFRGRAAICPLLHTHAHTCILMCHTHAHACHTPPTHVHAPHTSHTRACTTHINTCACTTHMPHVHMLHMHTHKHAHSHNHTGLQGGGIKPGSSPGFRRVTALTRGRRRRKGQGEEKGS